MSKSNMDRAVYDRQESQLSEQSQAFLRLLTKRGILEDTAIDDEKIRQAEKAKKRNMYHNTYLMLQHYRDIVWALECFPAQIAEELDRPMKDLDALISAVSAEIGMDNTRLEHRLLSVQKSRLLLDRFHEALTVLKQKPGNGQMLYDILYHTYLSPDTMRHVEILYRLDISDRHFYRLRTQAINILSIRLWASPSAELDSWLEVLTILEAL